MIDDVQAIVVRPFQKGDIVFLRSKHTLNVDAMNKLKATFEDALDHLGIQIIILPEGIDVVGKPKE